MTIDSFARVFKEWELGVRSMQYQKTKSGRIPAGDLERFRKLEDRMDTAFLALGPFDQESFWSETQKKRRQSCKQQTGRK